MCKSKKIFHVIFIIKCFSLHSSLSFSTCYYLIFKKVVLIVLASINTYETHFENNVELPNFTKICVRITPFLEE